jgi:hypothetical protein
MNPFQPLGEYESFVYTLPQQFASILRSTLIVARRGRLLAELSGELAFADGRRLNVAQYNIPLPSPTQQRIEK